jgi:hypothetical protein
MKKINSTLLLLFLLTLIQSCGGDDLMVPKPPTYLRMDLPDHAYQKVNSTCGFELELSKEYSLSESNTTGKIKREIVFIPLFTSTE